MANFNIFSALFLQLLVKKDHLSQKVIFNIPHTFKVKTIKYVAQRITTWANDINMISPKTLEKLQKHTEPSICTMG